MKKLCKGLVGRVVVSLAMLGSGCANFNPNTERELIRERIIHRSNAKNGIVEGKTKSRPYTRDEKLLFGAAILGQVADYYTTDKILDRGGYERNPLMGRHPNDGTILLFKGGVIGLAYLIGEIKPEARKPLYTILAGIGFGAAGYNWSQ